MTATTTPGVPQVPELPATDLATWTAQQRWFSGKGRPWHVTAVQVLAELGGWDAGDEMPPCAAAGQAGPEQGGSEQGGYSGSGQAGPEEGAPSPPGTDALDLLPLVRLQLVAVSYDDGAAPATELLQVPVAVYPAPVEALAHALVGEAPGTGGAPSDGTGTQAPVAWYYDALHDKQAVCLLAGALADARTVSGTSFHRPPQGPEVDPSWPSLVMGAEQSNTSVVLGDRLVVKFFRRVGGGTNPDIEVHEALGAAGCEGVARLAGWIEGTWEAADGRLVTGSLAMAQEFLAGGTEGWDLALTSVRDLLAEADLHADEVGGDFAGEAHRLGEATAQVHRDLAAALPTTELGPGELDGRSRAMRRRLDEAVEVVPGLAPHAPRLAAAYEALARLPQPVPAQRVHGDLHLGQTMRTTDGWRLLDFEGEPAKALEERREPDSPLRDVAGMLRSIDYAAWYMLLDHSTPQRAYRAAEWAERNRAAFCEGYAQVSGTDPREQSVLLRALETDKAVYEAVYEARNRPGWLRVPMAAIERLAGAGS